MVSLSDTEAKRRIRNYSLGMRQRLGIAHALLGDPSVLILDEPANGLDPAGIRWMRGLLKGYAERGGTVLLSSHLLNEVQVIADDIIMIGKGKIVAEGTPQSLMKNSGSFVKALDNDQLAQALRRTVSPAHPSATASAWTPRPCRSARSRRPTRSPSSNSVPPTAASRTSSSS